MHCIFCTTIFMEFSWNSMQFFDIRIYAMILWYPFDYFLIKFWSQKPYLEYFMISRIQTIFFFNVIFCNFENCTSSIMIKLSSDFLDVKFWYHFLMPISLNFDTRIIGTTFFPYNLYTAFYLKIVHLYKNFFISDIQTTIQHLQLHLPNYPIWPSNLYHLY